MSAVAWSLEDEQRLCELAGQNLSVAEIAVAMARSPGSITARLSRLGIITTHGLPSIRRRILELAAEGATPGRIARQTGVSEFGVIVILRRAGIEPRAIVSYRGPDPRRASV